MAKQQNSGKPVRSEDQVKIEAPKIEVNHGNAVILTVKFLELVLNELKEIRRILENGRP